MQIISVDIAKLSSVEMSRQEKQRELCTGEATCSQRKEEEEKERADGAKQKNKIASDRRVKM